MEPPPSNPLDLVHDSEPLDEFDGHFEELERWELPTNVIRLSSTLPSGQKKLVFLVGTAHVSHTSAKLVRDVMVRVRPSTIVLELDSSRIGILRTMPPAANEADSSSPTSSQEAKKSIFSSQFLRNIRQSGVLGVFRVVESSFSCQALLQTMYSGISEKLKIQPGEEFRTAVAVAQRLGRPVHVVLGDRLVAITLQRVWHSLSIWDRLRFGYMLLSSLRADVDEELIESLLSSDMLELLMTEMKEMFPSIMTPLIYERDQYLAHSIKNSPGRIVVGVVGLGHVEGIQQNWDREVQLHEEESELTNRSMLPISTRYHCRIR